MNSIWSKLLGLMDRQERMRAALLLVLMLLVAMVEAAGVASVMPFIAVLSNPGVVETNPLLQAVYAQLGFRSVKAFLYFLGFSVLLLLIGSLCLKAVALWFQLRFAHTRHLNWSIRLLSRYLYQPYEWFLNRNSSALVAALTSEINRIIHTSLLSAMQVVAQGLLVIFLVGLVIAVDPTVALVTIVALGGSFGAVLTLSKRATRRLGKEWQDAHRARYKVATDAFGGIKDIKLGGLEETFVQRFAQPMDMLTRRQVSLELMGKLPPFAMQGILFGGMMGVLLYLLRSYGGLSEALPVIGLYAFAGYRVLPALQSLYGHLTSVRSAEATLDALLTDLAPPADRVEGTVATAERIDNVSCAIELMDVTYRYPGADSTALRSINLMIPAFATVGLVGETGSGKTTAVDVILGLLAPSEGVLRVDGQVIDRSRLRSWQALVGYVPQAIFLADDTIEANIAFGVPQGEIKLDAVVAAAKAANLHDFVTSLRDGYDTVVGERGVRLSGGQRQRIGIARALYRDPPVLILDEATSALDTLTEQAVMEAVRNLSGRKTIVIIAHRLSTVMTCDRLFLLDRGRLVAEGKYHELVETHPTFGRMAATSGEERSGTATEPVTPTRRGIAAASGGPVESVEG